MPPFSNDNVLRAVVNDWLHYDKEIYVYDSNYSIKHSHFDGDSIYLTYNPLICYFNYYVYADDDDDGDDEILETHKLVLFIKKLSWMETGSEGCGWMDYDREYKIYLARTIDDIVNYAISPKEKIMFTLT